ncbi:MAG TPA: type II toxin-antitoxin system YafQ family toxin [Hanamia sp.]|nr:type II toxin-antitoxin system YafQ family toxin [Hanamia sp.]
MEVTFSSSFKKAFAKRIKGTGSETEFWERLEIFTAEPFNARLRTHKLSGKLEGLFAFSVGDDKRVVFYFTRDKPKKAIFIDIGSHDEVY